MRPWVRILSAVTVTVALIAFPAAAQAQSSDPGSGTTISWTVRPSDGRAEDGRPWIELDLYPGQSVQEHLLVRNLGRTTVTFRLSGADGYFTSAGRFNMLAAGRESKDAGTWISMQDTVTVASGAAAIVPFTVTVPGDATPGDHPAGVAAGVRSGAGEVGVESRVGFRVMTRVKGRIAPSLQTQVSGVYAGSVNPFEPGSVGVSYTVTNTGNARLSVAPSARISGPFGWFAQEVVLPSISEVAPGESRTLKATVRSVWPLFLISVSGMARGAAVSEDLDVGIVPVAADSAVAPALPWSQLVVLAVIGLLVAMSWYERRRRRRKMTELIERVKAEARAGAGSALAPAGDQPTVPFASPQPRP